MLASRTSRWLIGTAVLCVALLAATWFLLVAPRRAEVQDLRAQRVATEDQAALLRVRIAELQDQFASLDERREELAAVRKQLPTTAAVPNLVRTLESYAETAGVTLNSIAPGPPALYAPDGQEASAASPAPGAAGQLVTIPLSLDVEGSYAEITLFLRYVQAKMQRAYLISSIQLAKPEETVASPTTGTTPGATSTPAPTTTAGATPAPTTPAPAVTQSPLDQVTIAITGEVFALTDGTSPATAGPAGAPVQPAPGAPAPGGAPSGGTATN